MYQINTADTISRVPVHYDISADTTDLQELEEICVVHVISHLPAGSQRLDSHCKPQSEDSLCQQL